MEKITVYRTIQTRYRNIWEPGWTKWQNYYGSYEEAAQYAKDVTAQNANIRMQVAFFFYDEEGREVSWNPGEVYGLGHVVDY